MARIETNSLVQGISGKVCAHDDVYFRTNKRTGKVVAVRLCNPSTKESTAKQKAQQEKFRQQSQTTSQWFSQNLPGSQAYEDAYQDFLAQKRYATFMTYMRARLTRQGTSGTTTPAAGGSGSAGGGSSTDGGREV